MAKNTLSSRFRKLDIDQFDENKFVEESQEEAAENQQHSGADEGAVESLLRGHIFFAALWTLTWMPLCGDLLTYVLQFHHMDLVVNNQGSRNHTVSESRDPEEDRHSGEPVETPSVLF